MYAYIYIYIYTHTSILISIYLSTYNNNCHSPLPPENFQSRRLCFEQYTTGRNNNINKNDVRIGMTRRS